MGDIHVIQIVCVTPLGGCNWPFVVSLNVSSYPFPIGVAHSSWQWSSYRRLIFFPLFLSLLIGNVHHYPICFLLFTFNHHFINFLFCSFSIYRSIFFQFNPSIAISHIFLFSFQSLFFKISNFVLRTFVEFFFLSISSFNSNLCCFIFFSVWPSFFFFSF
jgi:hypothetical protein